MSDSGWKIVLGVLWSLLSVTMLVTAGATDETLVRVLWMAAGAFAAGNAAIFFTAAQKDRRK